MGPATLARGAVVFVVLLGALGMVTWRQSRALESLASLDELHRQMSVAAAERVELEREILAKATAWFARETGSVARKRSSS